MARYVVLSDNIVANVVVAEGDALGLIRSDTANIGDIYDPETGEFTQPPDPPEPPPSIPETATNSDWRVGLILWGRFAEVEKKVVAARDSGTVEGLIVWQRWEYANEVFRSELMALRETFGFSADDVDESMRRGAAVTAAARAAG